MSTDAHDYVAGLRSACCGARLILQGTSTYCRCCGDSVAKWGGPVSEDDVIDGKWQRPTVDAETYRWQRAHPEDAEVEAEARAEKEGRRTMDLLDMSESTPLLEVDDVDALAAAYADLSRPSPLSAPALAERRQMAGVRCHSIR